jgi:hypothetical protein
MTSIHNSMDLFPGEKKEALMLRLLGTAWLDAQLSHK